MNATVHPGPLAGTVVAPPSKSDTHRAILAAAFSDGGRILRPLRSADTLSSARAVAAFGASVDWTEPSASATHEGDGHEPGDYVGSERGTGAVTEDDTARAPRERGSSETDGASPGRPVEQQGSGRPETVTVEGFAGSPTVPETVIDCANSGTTMRLATATAGLVEGTTVLTGDASLRSRPQGALLEALEALGANARSTRENGRAPIVVEGPMRGGTTTLPGEVSSQFVSALLLAGASTPEGIRIDLTSSLVSAPYVELTRSVLSTFGVDVSLDPTGSPEGYRAYSVPGGQRFAAPAEGYLVSSDFSSISYLLALGAVAAEAGLTVTGATPSPQGDTAIVDILDRMGADIAWDRDAGEIDVARAPLNGVTVDVGDTPDLLPTIAALGAVADGRTRIVNAGHVRLKETDRIAAMAAELERLGVAVEEHEDELVVTGSPAGPGGGTTVDSHGDHRIAMALSIPAVRADRPITIAGAEHVEVSFPGYFETLASLGIEIDRN